MPRKNRTVGTVNDVVIVSWDVQAFLLLEEHRFLTSDHVADLTGRTRDTARRRFTLLLTAGFVGIASAKLNPKGNEPRYFALANKGAQYLAAMKATDAPKVEWGDKNRYYKATSLQHKMLSNEFLVRTKLALTEMGARPISREEIFAGAPNLHPKNPNKIVAYYRERPNDREREERSGVPDEFFGFELQDLSCRYLIIEADRSTMPQIRSAQVDQSNILHKMERYYWWWNDDLHTYVYGIKRFRVLFLTGKSRQRALNMKTTNELVRDGGWNGFLFAYINDLLEADNILEAPILNGNGKYSTLLD